MSETGVRVRRMTYHEVLLDGDPIGSIVRQPDGQLEGRLYGYPTATWIGRGKVDDVAAALIDHELDQRQTNPNRHGVNIALRRLHGVVQRYDGLL